MTKIQQLIMLINNLSIGIIFPVLNLILLEKGAGLSTLPILMALYAITVLCFELPSGICADLFGRKKVFLVSCGFLLLSFLLLLIANNLLWLIFVIIFAGLSRSFSSGSLDALIIDQAIENNGMDNLSKTTSRLAVLEAVGLAVGGISGGLISYAFGSFSAILLLRITFTIIIALLCFFFVKEGNSQSDAKERVPLVVHLKNSKEVIFSTPGFRMIFISVFFVGFLLLTMETYWQSAFLKISFFSDSTWIFGIITFLGFMAVTIGNIISNKTLHKLKHPHWKVYQISRIVLGIAIIALSFQRSVIGFILGYAGVYLILGTGNVAENTLINEATPNNMRASILSLESFITQIGVLCSSILCSMLVGRIHISGIWRMAGILLVAYTLLFIIVRGGKKDGGASEPVQDIPIE